MKIRLDINEAWKRLNEATTPRIPEGLDGIRVEDAFRIVLKAGGMTTNEVEDVIKRLKEVK